MFGNNNVQAMCHNLSEDRGVWNHIARILAKEEIPAPVSSMFYQEVVVAVLLCGSESWCLPPSAFHKLEGFHWEAARRFTGMRPNKPGETWEYLKSATVLEKYRLLTVRENIIKQRQTAAVLVTGRPVLKECMKMGRISVTVPRTMWWDQDIDWEMAHEVAASHAEKTAGGPTPVP